MAPNSNVDPIKFMKRNFQLTLFFTLSALSLSSLISPPIALACGILFALILGHPYLKNNAKITKYLLQISVVGLGFGMNLNEVWLAGKTGFWFTVITVFGTIGIGWLFGRLLNVDSQTSCLISSGTAICGGSAIAAVGAVLKADPKSMSIALVTVFFLNSLALFIFPPIGHALNLSQEQFGIWAAIAIHDTSSVVGASSKYGEVALQVATTVKLTRALWIIPLALCISFLTHRKSAKITIPWFILFFLLVATLRTLVPQGEPVYLYLKSLAKLGLTLTLFLIGAGLTPDAFRTVGFRAMIQGVFLWILISLVGLWGVQHVVPK